MIYKENICLDVLDKEARDSCQGRVLSDWLNHVDDQKNRMEGDTHIVFDVEGEVYISYRCIFTNIRDFT